MDTDTLIVHVKTNDFCKDIIEDVETIFDTWNFKIDKPLPKGIGLIKGELGGQIMKEFCRIKSKNI